MIKKKINRGGVLLLALTLTLSMMLSQVSVFADTAEVPMLLTVKTKPLDYTVTERIDMSVTKGETVLTIDPVYVDNGATEELVVSSIVINPASGWTVESASTDFTTASKTALGFTYDGHDFSNGAYEPADTLLLAGAISYQLSGKISAKADLMSATQVASMVVTVEKSVDIISFKIVNKMSGKEYDLNALDGMIWYEAKIVDGLNQGATENSWLTSTYDTTRSDMDLFPEEEKIMETWDCGYLYSDESCTTYVLKSDTIIANKTYYVYY